MINQAYALNSYTQARAVTAIDPLELIVMLYDGAIDSLEKSVEAINRKDIPAKLKNIDKTLAILEELEGSLNMEAGGRVSENLQQLYQYIMKELVAANLKNDQLRIRKAINLLEDLRGMFDKKALPAVSVMRAS
ncbi:MAG: flagellar export chaperone FliS [Gallionella sp.]|nr:flagellar export chaperone FliS [Gallionella sp.]